MKLSTKCILVFFGAVLAVPTAAFGHNGIQHKVLILHSYHHGLQWTNDVMDGIDSVFKDSEMEIEMFVEYMDTKRHDPKAFSPILFDLYKKRYRDEQFDAIIVSDNNALEFLLAYRDELFPAVPVIFCGINNYSDAMIKGQNKITGVAEALSIQKTINLARLLNPDLKLIAVVNDRTPTGLQNQMMLEEAKGRLEYDLDFEDYINLTFEELLGKLKRLPRDSAVLLFTFYRDRKGRLSAREEFVPAVSRSASVPTYTFWKQQMGLGVTGGIIVDGKLHGANAAEITLRVLHGAPVESIPVMKESPNVMMLDFAQLKRFDVDLSRVPQGALFVNKPPSFYKDHREVIWRMTGGVVVLFAVVFGFARMRTQKRIEEVNVQLTKEIEERRRAERSLRQSEERYSSLVSNIPSVTWISDDRGRTTFISPNIEKIYGYTAEEIYNAGEELWFGRIHAEDIQRVQLEYRDLFRNNKAFDLEYRIQRKDSQWIWIHDRAVSTIESEQGIHAYGVFSDITDRKRAEEALKKTTALISSIRDAQNLFIDSRDHGQVFENLLDTLVSMTDSEYGFLSEVLSDDNGKYYRRSLARSNIAWDEDSLKLYEEVKGSNLEFRNFDNLTGAPVTSGRLVIANEPLHDPRSGGLPEGHPPIESFLGIPLYFGRELVGVAGVANRRGGYTEAVAESLEPFVATCASIISAIRSKRSEKKYLERIRESLEEKEVLLREVHHRVKNNFQIINSLLRLQSENIQGKELRDIFVDVENRIKSMAMVHEMLYSEGDLSQVDIGGYINALTHGLYRSYHMTPDKVRIRIEIEEVKMGIDSAVPFGMVVNELVSNAMKHAFPGEMKGEILISLRPVAEGKEYELKVADNGVGLDEGMDIRKSGTLGLRLVVNIVERQIGGKLEVSRENGTEFMIRFSDNTDRHIVQ